MLGPYCDEQNYILPQDLLTPGTGECATIMAKPLLRTLVWEEVRMLHVEDDGGFTEQEIMTLKAEQAEEENPPICLKKEHIAVTHCFEGH